MQTKAQKEWYARNKDRILAKNKSITQEKQEKNERETGFKRIPKSVEEREAISKRVKSYWEANFEKHFATCQICGHTFRVCKSQLKRKYCGEKCMGIAKRGTVSPWRGQKRPDIKKKTPRSAFKKGTRPHNYIDGKRRSNEIIIRGSIEGKKWRKDVFVRDKYTCQKCGEVGGRLHAHHIRNFISQPMLRFDIDNGITLCLIHHKEFHKIYGLKDNNMKQINEYVNSKESIYGVAI